MRDLRIAQGAALGSVALAFPVAALAVHAGGADRGAVADALGLVFSVGIYAAVSAPWWPWARRPDDRLRETCLVWFWTTFTIHLTWELGYLVLHDAIVAAPDAAWSYAWWSYIDGGDRRYAAAGPDLLALETLSVVNGAIGMTALVTYLRRGTAPERPRRLAVLALMATAVVHLYSTSYYFATELYAGLPNVDTASAGDLWIKFVLANSPWLVLPWAVLVWGERELRRAP